ncbi:MAG: acyl-CoA dehydrogenase family protein [Myxococcota bacterium]
MHTSDDFGFTEEHALLRSGVRRFLEEHGGSEAIRRLIEQPGAFDARLHRQMAELGWLGLVAPEAHGGAGMGWLHLALVLEEMGRALVPSAFFPCVLAALAIDRGGDDAQKGRWLPGLVGGERVATLALCEPASSWEPEAVSATAEPAGDGHVLQGVKTHVASGAEASLMIAPLREPGGAVHLYAVELDATGVRVEREEGLDPTRPTARVVLEGVRVPGAARLAGGDRHALADVWRRARTLLAAEMTGGIDRVVTMTRDYAKERVQFGRAIGSFQAVKHPLVDAMIGVEQVRSLVYGAAAALDGRFDDAEPLSRMAKALASDVYAFAVRKGVQLHGGFGFTWECDVHFWFRRAMWSRAMLGDAVHHRRHLGEHLVT